MVAMPAVLTAILVFVMAALALVLISLLAVFVRGFYCLWMHRRQAQRLLDAEWWPRFEREFCAYASSSPRSRSRP